MPHRCPWSDDDLNILSDGIADGLTRKAIGERLGRSIDAVTGMSRKVGLQIRRGKTRQLPLQIQEGEYDALAKVAAKRRLSVNTLARVLLELCARCPTHVAELLDDDDRHLNAPDAPLTPTRHKAVDIFPEPEPMPEPPPLVPPAAVPLAMMLQPMLEARCE